MARRPQIKSQEEREARLISCIETLQKKIEIERNNNSLEDYLGGPDYGRLKGNIDRLLLGLTNKKTNPHEYAPETMQAIQSYRELIDSLEQELYAEGLQKRINAASARISFEKRKKYTHEQQKKLGGLMSKDADAKNPRY
jgi:hypothetical protein